MDTMTPPIRVQMLGGYIEVTSDSQNEVSTVTGSRAVGTGTSVIGYQVVEFY